MGCLVQEGLTQTQHSLAIFCVALLLVSTSHHCDSSIVSNRCQPQTRVINADCYSILTFRTTSECLSMLAIAIEHLPIHAPTSSTEAERRCWGSWVAQIVSEGFCAAKSDRWYVFPSIAFTTTKWLGLCTMLSTSCARVNQR